MKLKTFYADDFKGRGGKPAISIAYKSGLISLNTQAIRLLGIDPKTATNPRILIMQDEERSKDWYICRSDDPRSHSIRKFKEIGYCLNNSMLARKILNSLDRLNSARFMIAGQPTEGNIYAILTNSAK